MYVRKFEGDSLEEALKAVKTELGPDAIILKTVTNKGLKGAFKKKRIEITAAISEQSYEKKSKVDHVLNQGQRDQFYQAPASRVNNMINEYDKNNTPERPNGYGNMGLNKVVNSVSKASNKIKSSLDDFLALEDANEMTDEQYMRKTQMAQKPRFEEPIFEEENHDEDLYKQLEEEQRRKEAHLQARREQEQEAQQKLERRKSQEITSELQQQIKTQNYQIEMLEQKLFELTEKMGSVKADNAEPIGLKSLRLTLRSLELSEKIIQDIIKKASFELKKEELEDEDTVFDFALREMSELISCEMPMFSSTKVEGTAVTALLSENSCGQSSMAIKMALMQDDVKIIRLRQHDIDQVNSEFTASVFKLDIATVSTLSHLMSEARKAVSDGQNIILDLKLSFKDKNETKKFIETLKRSFNNIEFLTTISGINSEIYNRKILSKFKNFSNGVIISYIDQCLSFGSIVNLHYDFNNQPLKFFGTGPTVPDDIEASSAERILAGMFQL